MPDAVKKYLSARNLGLALASGLLWYACLRREFLPLGQGYVASLFVLGTLGLGLEGLRLLVRPAAGSRAAMVFTFLRRWFLLTLAAGICATFLSRAVEISKAFATILATPYPVNIMEGGQALRSWLLGQGMEIYTDLGRYPCLVTVYAPLYYGAVAVTALCASPLAAWAGAHFPDLAFLSALAASPPLFFGRLVSALAFVAAIVCVCLIFRRQERSTPAAVLLGLYLWQFPEYMAFARYARVDMLGWTLFFLAAWLADRGARQDARANLSLAASALVLVLACMTKQQLVPLALPLAGWVFLRRKNFRAVLGLFLLPGLLFGAAGLGLAWISFGPDFFLNAVTFPKAMAKDIALNNPETMVSRLKAFFQCVPLFSILFGAHVLETLFRRRLSLFDLLLAVQLPLLVLSLQWWGGDSNYFIGPVFMAAPGAASLVLRFGALPRVGAFAVCLLLLALVTSKMNLLFEIDHASDFSVPSAREAGRLRELAETAQGPVLMESECASLVLSPEGFYFDAVETANMGRYGLWRFGGSQLQKDLLSRRFALVMNSSSFLTPEIRDALEAGYRRQETLRETEVYAPRPPAQALAFADLESLREGGITASMDNLVRLEGDACYAPADPSRPGILTLALPRSQPLDRLTLRFFPRIDAQSPDNVLTLSLAAPGGSLKTLYRLAGDGKGGWTPGWGIRQERVLDAPGQDAILRFELVGKAQLWMDEVRPLRLWLEPGSPALLGNRQDVR